MDSTTLVTPDIPVGRRITEALDSAAIPLTASLWFFDPDASEWRLIVASPQVDEIGPLKMYGLIQKVLKKLINQIDLPLRKISAVSPNDPLIRLLRSAVKTGTGISGIRFTHNTINGVFVEDAYIYRLT